MKLKFISLSKKHQNYFNSRKVLWRAGISPSSVSLGDTAVVAQGTPGPFPGLKGEALQRPG